VIDASLQLSQHVIVIRSTYVSRRTNAGRICGIIATILMIIAVVVLGLLFGLGFIGAIVSGHH